MNAPLLLLFVHILSAPLGQIHPATETTPAPFEPSVVDSVAIRNEDEPAHTLAPGDRIRIIIANQTEDFTLNPEGEVFLKGLGAVRLVGLAATDAALTVESTLRAKKITAPVSVFFLAPPTRSEKTIVVIGAVQKPGAYPAATLLGAVSNAQGFTDDANLTELRITSGDSTTIADASAILDGRARDIPLEGDEVIVVPNLPRILVSGAVAKPDWVSALTLFEAVSAAGGTLPEADLTKAEVRIADDTPAIINLAKIMSGAFEDPRLPDRARVTIPTRPRAIMPFVSVYGAVERPGTQRGFTLIDAIRDAKPDTSANLDSVILAPAGRDDSYTLNASAISEGQEPAPLLMEGDRIIIPRQESTPSDYPDTPRIVHVLGEVHKPGPAPPGPLTSILASVGGPTPAARTTTIRIRLSDTQAITANLDAILAGKADDPDIPANATVFVEPAEKSRAGLEGLKELLGLIAAVAGLLLRR